MSDGIRQRLRPEPAARYIHPRALDAPALAGMHGANLDEADESAPNYLRWIADLLRPHLGGSVLELGAGLGAITELYAPGHHVVATDVSDVFLDGLHSRFSGSPNVLVRRQDVRHLDQIDERFNSVVMISVLEHIEDDLGLLSSLRAVLVPGGTVVLYLPALNALYGAWDRRVGHYRRYSKWRLREMSQQAGLHVVDLRYVNLLAIPAWWAFSRTDVEKSTSTTLSIWDRTGVPLGRALESRVRIPIGLNLLAAFRVPG